MNGVDAIHGPKLDPLRRVFALTCVIALVIAVLIFTDVGRVQSPSPLSVRTQDLVMEMLSIQQQSAEPLPLAQGEAATDLISTSSLDHNESFSLGDMPNRQGSDARLVRKCIGEIIPTCNNRGLDRCQWRSSPCGFGQINTSGFMSAFSNMTVVFQGDSTLRELFSAWSYYCCPWAAPVEKADTNMTSRIVISRTLPSANMRSYFRFDYLFDHLHEPLLETRNRQVDVVVLGLGLYHAKAIATNETDAISFDEIKQRLAPLIVPHVCDVHKARYGIFVASWMECSAMKRHKARTVRQNHQVCSQSSQALSVVNRIVSMELARQKQRPDGCYVYFLRPLRCTKVRHPCTGDGVHARSGSEYGNSRFALLANSMKLAVSVA